jgi:tRNA(Ile)-lysidine synthase
LAKRVLAYIGRQGLLRPGDRVGVAVSGGADSTALLLLLCELEKELGVVLAVVHFNHRIRGAEADADERFVRELAASHGLEIHCSGADVPAEAQSRGLSVETAARELRYSYFRHLLRTQVVGRIATAHTRDDQAESVLLRLLRGAGTRGLAGIYPELRVVSGKPAAGRKPEAAEAGTIVRPLLEVGHRELTEYLRAAGQDWREDGSNRDVKHARNRVRHVLLPMVEKEFNPNIRQVLAETAEIARAEEEYWSGEVRHACKAVVLEPTERECWLGLDKLRRLPLALQRRVLREAAEGLGFQLEFQQVERVLALASARGEARVELGDGWMAEHKLYRNWEPGQTPRPELVFRRSAEAKCTAALAEKGVRAETAPGYEYILPLPGEVRVEELGVSIRALLVPRGSGRAGYNPEGWLDPQYLGSKLVVRNWRPGDRFCPAHTKSARKVKELLQARHITGRERALWPVAVNSAGEVVWMRGFAVPERFAAPENDGPAVVIHEHASSPN